MNHLRLAIAMLCAVGVSSAHADPIPTYYVTEANMFMGPNIVGGNLTFAFTGPGIDIDGFGGMGCFSWCTGQPIPPGSPFPLTRVFIANFTTAVVGGVTTDPFFLSDIGGVHGDHFFFDDFGGVNPIVNAVAGQGPTFTIFTLIMPTNGVWSLNFVPTTDENGNPAIAFTNGTFSASAPAPTPEPATIGLALAGSAGLGWITRRRKHRR
jgi:hypothetical protein